MRQGVCALAAIIALAAAPSTDAKTLCGSASVTAGAAPLTVAFTSTCGSVHWDFGDGWVADGESVQHTFAAGAFTVFAGTEKVADVTSRAVALRMPKLVGYTHRLTFRGAVVPPRSGERIVVRAAGASFALTTTRADGTFRVTRRIRRPGPYTAQWVDAVSAPVATTVKPQLLVRTEGARTVGGRLAVVARVVPATAGVTRIQVWRGARLLVNRTARRVTVPTDAAATLRVRVSTAPAPGFAARARTFSATVAVPYLRYGSHGPSVRALEQRLSDLHYALLGIDGWFGRDTYDAVLAFQKVNGLPRTGTVEPWLWRRLARAGVPRARYRGTHVEVDKARQVLFEVRNGSVVLVVPVSTGATGNTPVGVWRVYRRVVGFDWVLYYPTYFLRGFAIHGYPSVPAFPASHGCVRVPMWVATRLYAMHPYGYTIYIYA